MGIQRVEVIATVTNTTSKINLKQDKYILYYKLKL